MQTSPAKPLFTLVIVTYGRADCVLHLLKSIAAAGSELIDVVIVDQNEVNRVEVLLALHEHSQRLRHVRVSFQNASHARNFGVHQATTPWVAFPDDDATFTPGALAHALRLTAEPLDLIGGQIVDEQGRPHLIKWLSEEGEITPANIDRCFVESSFFIRREVFHKVGGFDPLFGPGAEFPAAEGADLMRRLWKGNGPLRTLYTPAIRIYHPDKLGHLAAQEETVRNRIYRFACAEGALTARHGQVLPLRAVGKKLLFRLVGACLSVGARRERKIAFLRGFATGWYRYRRLRSDDAVRNAVQEHKDRQTA